MNGIQSPRLEGALHGDGPTATRHCDDADRSITSRVTSVRTAIAVRTRVLAIALLGVVVSGIGGLDAFASTERDSTSATLQLKIAAPDVPAKRCTPDDFGTVAIRIGFHASLQDCYREIELSGQQATAFVTVPREFDEREITDEHFARLRDDIARSETAQYERSKLEGRPVSTQTTVNGESSAIPLGVFDNAINRIGYAYAFGVTRAEKDGRATTQAMMRTETFIHVRDTVVVMLLIAPIDSGASAGAVFDLSERWANAIIAANAVNTAGWQAPRSEPQVIEKRGVVR